MCSLRARALRSTFVLTAIAAVGCVQPTHGAGSKPDGFRLVSGSVDATDSASLGQSLCTGP